MPLDNLPKSRSACTAVQPAIGRNAASKRTTVAAAARAHNEEQLDAFKSRLVKLEPIYFERFVK